MSTEQPHISSYQDLVNLLAKDGVQHEVDAASKSARIRTEQNGIVGVQLIRWQEEDGVLQFIQSMPVEVEDDRMAAIESAAARLNHALAWPGLDVNHEYHMVAFRVVLPLLPRGFVLPQEIRACFRLAVKTAADLTPTMLRVLTGVTSAADALADAQRELAANAQAANAAAAAAPAPAAPEANANASKPSDPPKSGGGAPPAPPAVFNID